MVIDVLTFNGEYDLLEIRLNILNKFVDEFIIVEADTTFSGLPKKLYYPQKRERYRPFFKKIKYCVIKQKELDEDKELNDLADASPSVPKNMHWWRREFMQKEAIKNFLTHLHNDDIVYVSDCDEIWKPKVIGDGIYKLRQLMYAYYLNNRSSEPWAGTFVTKYNKIKDGNLNYMRLIPPADWVEFLRLENPEFLEDGGWHFTSMGGVDELRRKIESYGHQELNTPEVINNLQVRISRNEDFIGRPFTFTKDESQLPQYIINNKELYNHLLKP